MANAKRMKREDVVKEMREILNWIKKYPNTHDQAEWICGSTACFFGHKVLMDIGKNLPDKSVLSIGLSKAETPQESNRIIKHFYLDYCDKDGFDFNYFSYVKTRWGLGYTGVKSFTNRHTSINDLEEMVSLLEEGQLTWIWDKNT